MKLSLREQIQAAFFAIIIAGLSQLTIPLGLIPLTGQTFAIGLAVTFLGTRTGTMSIMIYLLLGLIGLPVFAGFTSGIGILLGPTGGYLVGFLFNGLLTGTMLSYRPDAYWWGIIANIAGAFATLAFGTLWLKWSTGMTWLAAFNGGFVLFILPGIIKAVAAAILGIFLRKRLGGKLALK
ncbi:biotin transporter BioY [Enterococcus sp. DIV0876]|uniref:biotin transporter BioY n=1 Tax=Enterococcus sp. DIV0876 TaxID=2774633 RepID=UPI003D2FE8B3